MVWGIRVGNGGVGVHVIVGYGGLAMRPTDVQQVLLWEKHASFKQFGVYGLCHVTKVLLRTRNVLAFYFRLFFVKSLKLSFPGFGTK